MSKPANLALQSKGIQLRALDLDGPVESIIAALRGIDILISAIGPRDQLAQLPLVIAAQQARIQRFVPCGYAPVMPVGAHQSRDQKEEVYNLTKRLHIPYTIIDVGWWYQFSLPKLPSGKIDYAMTLPLIPIPGDGNVLSALTDLRDVGKYVVRAVKDKRTLNRTVFAYNELWTVNQIYDALERISGEKIVRVYESAQSLEEKIAAAEMALSEKPQDFMARAKKVTAQYFISWGVRGENTPEFADYLGYWDGKKLYPDVEFTSFKSYLEEVVSGKANCVYDELSHSLKSAVEPVPEER